MAESLFSSKKQMHAHIQNEVSQKYLDFILKIFFSKSQSISQELLLSLCTNGETEAQKCSVFHLALIGRVTGQFLNDLNWQYWLKLYWEKEKTPPVIWFTNLGHQNGMLWVGAFTVANNFWFFFINWLLEYRHNIAYFSYSNQQEHILFRLCMTNTGTLVLSYAIYSCILTPYQ